MNRLPMKTTANLERGASFWNGDRIYLLSRLIIAVSVSSALGTLLLKPGSVTGYLLDVVVRSYLMFVGCVMAHEASHGHLGKSRAANFWWGRIALIPTTVPFVTFRKTHHLHHAHTNVPGEDPDHFIKPGSLLEIPLRCLALPHYWFYWLLKNRRMKRQDWIEWIMNYVAVAAVFGPILAVVGPSRIFWGMGPAFLVVSILLWYSFAIKTHEGFSLGRPEQRSHNYFGRWIYWFSLGLSMHRVHHTRETLAWLELRSYVEEAPGSSWRRLGIRRDIRAA